LPFFIPFCSKSKSFYQNLDKNTEGVKSQSFLTFFSKKRENAVRSAARQRHVNSGFDFVQRTPVHGTSLEWRKSKTAARGLGFVRGGASYKLSYGFLEKTTNFVV
jgi:hypothetical protein